MVAGLTVTVSPLFTAMFPGVMTPEAPVNVGVKVVDPPEAIADEAGSKFEMAAGATSVTVETSLYLVDVVPLRVLEMRTL